MPDFHLFPSNPYPPIHAPIAHKVWILDCSSCGAFLTNRAMKAVLLLRPNVSLFSSDALPTGCSPYSPGPDSPPPLAPHKQPSASSRTCECVTQNLCCHSCGTAVGYNILYPCTRCTSSISATNRVTNGHRFVFHSSEVVGTERRYVRHEPGVVPFHPPLFAPPPPPPPPPPHPAAPVFRSEYLPTPPLEFATPAYTLDASPSRAHLYTRPRYTLPDSDPLLTADQKDSDPDSDALGPSAARPPTPSLSPGDLVFWHHLARRGEIPRVRDDPRARLDAHQRAEAFVFFNR